jgi:hypothetical protein
LLLLQVDKILDPLGHLDEDSELCVFDDHGRAYCTENAWNDQGIKYPGRCYTAPRFFFEPIAR